MTQFGAYPPAPAPRTPNEPMRMPSSFPADSHIPTEAKAEAQTAARRGDNLVDVVDRVRDEAQRHIDKTRADTRLSNEAKAADVATLTAEANARITALSAEHEASMQRRIDELRRGLCTPSSTAIGAERVAIDASFRDALERAKRTELQEGTKHPLIDVFNSARITGDTLQQRACLVEALARNDVDVMNAWLADHPEDDRALNDLYAISRETVDITAQFNRSMQFRPIS